MNSGTFSYAAKRINRPKKGIKIQIPDLFQITQHSDTCNKSVEKTGKALENMFFISFPYQKRHQSIVRVTHIESLKNFYYIREIFKKMRPEHLFVFLILCFINSSCKTDDENSENKNIIISKAKYKNNTSEIDTLWVSQNDTTVFKREDVIITRPCSNPESAVRYDLINPIDSAYYFIYNDKQQLIMEGKYTYAYTYPDAPTKTGNFYNSKSYYYRKNGNLDLIHYMKDGRNFKSEYFDRKKRLKKIRYFDLKSSDIEKIEIYSKGELIETRIFTSFDRYYTVKAGL